MIRKRICLLVVLICVTLLPLTACGGANNRQLAVYLAPYEEQATAFLLKEESFLATYGSDCELDSSSFSFTYLDPKKYSSVSLSPKIPATAEEFAQELKELQVNYYLPDDRACSVFFQKTPEGGLEITGWEFTDESPN